MAEGDAPEVGLLPPPAWLAAARGGDCSHRDPLGSFRLTDVVVTRSSEDLGGLRLQSPDGVNHHRCKERGGVVRTTQL